MPRPSHEAAEASRGDSEDVRLMHLIKHGDTEAFEKLVRTHQALVAGTVARMLGSNGEVDDIAQQVFVRVWKSAGRYVPKAKFTTWLLKITRNLVFNELRRVKRQSSITLDSEPGGDEMQFEDSRTQTPDASLLTRELQAAIEAGIAALPENQRLALILRRYEGLSYDEIGEVLELSVPAVKSVLFRARTELRQSLSVYLGG